MFAYSVEYHDGRERKHGRARSMLAVHYAMRETFGRVRYSAGEESTSGIPYPEEIARAGVIDVYEITADAVVLKASIRPYNRERVTA